MPNEKPPKTDWSFLDDRNKKPQKSKTDWSFLDGKGEPKTTNEDIQKKIDEMIETMKADIKEKSKIGQKQDYERIKREIEKFRQEHGIHLSEDEIKRKDQELRKRLGIE